MVGTWKILESGKGDGIRHCSLRSADDCKILNKLRTSQDAVGNSFHPEVFFFSTVCFLGFFQRNLLGFMICQRERCFAAHL